MTIQDLKNLPLISSTNSSVSVGVVSVIIKDNQVLMVKSKDSDIWKFPGGHLHHDESIDEGIIRETLEETGYVVQIIGQPFVYQYDLTQVLNLFLIFCRTEIIGNGSPEQSDEITETKWFETDKMPENIFENVKPVLKYIQNI